MLTCKLCGHSTTMIHNRRFELEVNRLSTVYEQVEPTCPNKATPANRYYRDLENVTLFKDLMNKDIINRMMDKHNLGATVIYDKINFFYEQALAFDQYHSELLEHAVARRELNLSTDRQFYLSNWGDHDMPKPTPIVNTSTVDNESGFVFVSNVNFDFTSDYKGINKENREKKEQEKFPYYRRYAQYVLSNDEVNVCAPEAERTVELQMPPKGLLVQQTYSVLTHFALLKEILKYCPRIRLYADNDSGIKLAIGAIFPDWIADEILYAFQISADKAGSAQYLDEASTEHLNKVKSALIKENPDIGKPEIKARLWQEQLSNRMRVGNAKSEWIINPNKESRLGMLLPLGDVKNMNQQQVIKSLTNASLHGVDNWFQILRRHVNFFRASRDQCLQFKALECLCGSQP